MYMISYNMSNHFNNVSISLINHADYNNHGVRYYNINAYNILCLLVLYIFTIELKTSDHRRVISCVHDTPRLNYF